MECGVRNEGRGKGSALPRLRHSRGFTLLEVLLSMAILVVIMTVIYASFSTAGNNVEQAERVRDDTDIARTLIARLSTDIQNAYFEAERRLRRDLPGQKRGSPGGSRAKPTRRSGTIA